MSSFSFEKPGNLSDNVGDGIGLCPRVSDIPRLLLEFCCTVSALFPPVAGPGSGSRVHPISGSHPANESLVTNKLRAHSIKCK